MKKSEWIILIPFLLLLISAIAFSLHIYKSLPETFPDVTNRETVTVAYERFALEIAAKTPEGVKGEAHLVGIHKPTVKVTAVSWVDEPVDWLNEPSRAGTNEDLSIGPMYSFKPYDLKFERPATLTLSYTEEVAMGRYPTNFDIYKNNPEGRNWLPMKAEHDIEKRMLTTAIDQLGTFTIGQDTTSPKFKRDYFHFPEVYTWTHFPQINAYILDYGSGIDPSTVSVAIDGHPLDSEYFKFMPSIDIWIKPYFLSNGEHTYAIAATDTSGNGARFEGSFRIEVPQPSIGSIVPSIVYSDRYTQVEIKGDVVAYGAVIELGEKQLSNKEYKGDEMSLVKIPSGLKHGRYDLTITNPDGGVGTLSDAILITVPGDVNGDCTVNASDIQDLEAHLQEEIGLPYDLNGDGKATNEDVSEVRKSLGTTCNQ